MTVLGERNAEQLQDFFQQTSAPDLAPNEQLCYISSSMNDRATSDGTRRSRLTRGPSFKIGSAACNAGTSVRSKNLPMGISSPHSTDFSIAAVQSDAS